MYTRIVECHVKPEKKDEFSNRLRSEVIPTLQKQSGFVDFIELGSEHERERVLCISFWNTREDAERYQREQYNKIVDVVRPLVKRDPTVETFNVHTSVTHRIAAGRAA